MSPLTLDELREATSIERSLVRPTPAHAWSLLARRTGVEVVVKHESHTPTGSFEAGDGVVYVDMLRRENRIPAGLVTATRGNHGQSTVVAAKQAGIPALIVVPRAQPRRMTAPTRGTRVFPRGNAGHKARRLIDGDNGQLHRGVGEHVDHPDQVWRGTRGFWHFPQTVPG